MAAGSRCTQRAEAVGTGWCVRKGIRGAKQHIKGLRLASRGGQQDRLLLSGRGGRRVRGQEELDRVHEPPLSCESQGGCLGRLGLHLGMGSVGQQPAINTAEKFRHAQYSNRTNT
eukprot:scaffold59675_cov35-Prasinocladus_malaysianus.AAC.1